MINAKCSTVPFAMGVHGIAGIVVTALAVGSVCFTQNHPQRERQRPGGRSDQSLEDDQKCNVWQSRRGVPQSTHAAAKQY